MPHFAAPEFVLNNFCFSPKAGNTLTEKLADCYQQFVESSCNYTALTVIRQTVFISAETPTEYHQKKQILLDCATLYFDNLPPTSIIAQGPENGSLLVEIVSVDGLKPGELNFKKNEEASWLVLQRNNSKVLIAAGLGEIGLSNCILQQSMKAFELMQGILLEEEMEFSDILRQWNYIEKITEKTGYNNSISQHYQIFNDVRSKFYQLASFNNGFPAATGIGMDFGGINIDFIACKTMVENSIIGIKNPVQWDAYAYSKEVLAENSAMSDYCQTTPKFERAKVFLSSKGKWIFISGTAAIVGQSSIMENSVDQQTEMTIQNILSLISAENLQKHGIHFTGEITMDYLRAYIKFKSDLPQVKKICRQYFPQIPIAFVVADICRPELLVEIEGQAFIH